MVEPSASTAEDDLFAQTDPDSEAETKTEEDPKSIFMTVIDPLIDDFVANFREEELEQVIFSVLNDEDAKTEENDAIREIIIQLYSIDEIPIRHLSSRMPKSTSSEPTVVKPLELDLKEVGFGCHFEDSGEFGVKLDTMLSVVELTAILEIDGGFDLLQIPAIVSLSITPPPKPTPAISTRMSPPETPLPPRPPPEPPPSAFCRHLHKAACTVMSFPCV
ncbi:uncharacterized protein LOC130995728 [Salvia miltiorrhiza]|uniref:uncharacterized protein LOC130995728 n=1 Tax=Salvia miltiorrhiza TaxID=226208 RepID=UPI0025ACCB2A|nr:uncharacterized protein LOC130995728 [Salvia miltiorrhiza]